MSEHAANGTNGGNWLVAVPPSAPRSECVDVIHGRRMPDPYRWLEQDDSAETLRWIATQQAHFECHRNGWADRDPFRHRIGELLDHDSWSVPAVFDEHLLATRSTGLADYPELVVVQDGHTRTLLDPLNLDPTGLTQLDAWAPSLDGHLVAVQTSRRGTERGQLWVLDVQTGAAIDTPIDGVRHASVAWLPGDTGFYYVAELDDPGGGRSSPRGVWLHRLGTAPGTDQCLHRPSGPQPTVPIIRGDVEGRWLLISESYGTNHRNDLWIAEIPVADPAAVRLRVVQQGIDADTSGRIGPDGWLYLLTTLEAPRRRLCRTRPHEPGTGVWETVVAEDSTATLDEFVVLDDEVVVARTAGGRCELLAFPTPGSAPRRIDLPDERLAQHLTVSSGQDEAYLSVAGVTAPPTVHRLRPGASRLQPWSEASVHALLCPPITVSRTRNPALDGTAVRLTILQRRDLPVGPQPTILHAYGGHGNPRRLGFSASLLAWLEAGGRYVVAHVRGGGDEGREWHHAATRAGKLTTITDLVAAARWLNEHDLTCPKQLCLSGGSQGGLVVLAAAIRAPSACNAVIAHAPLADMLRSERMGLGANWTEEFGTVADTDEFEALLGYSPYHNVEPGRQYPAMLLTGFHSDARTGAAHPRKMCAALQRATADERPIVLRYEFDAGHARGALSRAIDLAADVHAFAAAWTGLSPGSVR